MEKHGMAMSNKQCCKSGQLKQTSHPHSDFPVNPTSKHPSQTSTHAHTHEDDCELDINVVVIFTMVLGPTVHAHREGQSSIEVESASKFEES